MRKTTALVFASAASISLGLAVAAPASAAPEDVTFAAVAEGNTITGTFTYTGETPVACQFLDVSTLDEASQSYGVTGLAFPDAGATSATATDQSVPAGDYTLDWSCAALSGERWGTAFYSGTAEQESVTVVDPVVEVPDPICTGSACLPTGSFGI